MSEAEEAIPAQEWPTPEQWPPEALDRLMHAVIYGFEEERDPWPLDWEQRPEKDTCAHDWHVHVTPNGSGGKPEPVLRCRKCHTPCCEHVYEFLTGDPCIERRHHAGMHIYESGRFEPLGGILPRDDE